MASPTAIAAYLALFTVIGAGFLFGNLFLGRFLRPKAPNPEKLEVYECGEPTIGSSFVQFDLRFYVVALLFIIFDVEVAFFFPWANVFGKSTNLADPHFAAVQPSTKSNQQGVELTPAGADLLRELGVRRPTVPPVVSESADGTVTARLPQTIEEGQKAVADGANKLAWLSMWDIGVFFAVLLVGFAYVWKRGDLDWVRAVTAERTDIDRPTPSETEPRSHPRSQPMLRA
ncbi:MAG TPA: NADH-quinone oxidoreductase subunit A [Pirellulales bacterium]|nr:NADH-quinone oxidoreductase subunit A [Pirellulales bacterium]